MNDKYYMELALKEAIKGMNNLEVPVGAIIVKNGKIISRAHNLKHIKNDVTKHAELIAIKKASKKLKDWRLNDCVIYVTLYPCPMCASAIVQSRLKKIVIGASTNDDKNKEIVELIFKSANIEVEKNILEEKCSLVLKNFFKIKRKK